MREFGLYVHIPFCQQKCFYCDFPSYAGKERFIDEYLRSLARELELVSQRLLGCVSAYNEKLMPRTVYIGGGTPSVLSVQELELLLDNLAGYVYVGKVQEFTVEVNPCSITKEKLELLHIKGVNRLSIGVQSFDEACLKKIGRVHSVEQAEAAVRMAQSAGFDNISVDLMYGLPSQNMDILQASVSRVLALGVQHISIYGLQLEDGTVFAKMEKLGKLTLPDDAECEKMYDYITDALPQAGYQRYEISNFAQVGYESKHNLSYWQDVPYIGIGSAAHSYYQTARYENAAAIQDYMADIAAGRILYHVEEAMSHKAHIEEYCFLALRTAKGISKTEFKEKFQQEIEELYGEKIKKLEKVGLVHEGADYISLTELGMKYGNQVFSEFLL